MDPERLKRIEELFSTVLALPRTERAAWLTSAASGDPYLVDEVESLLAAREGVVEGMRIGPYRVLTELGHGGMGAVYLAVRDQPGFTQTVAIKLIKRGMDTDQIVRRFLAERQILASLVHPNIARLLDGGSTVDGRPYFVMEHVEGQPITAYADERKLSIEARLRLFLRVCGAVQRAHQSLVVHRDLKPANILVDAEGEPKLLDFGIAKLLDPASFGGVAAMTGHVPGPMTPDYASPEQRTGGPITTATDVYGLGLLLYELLVGQSPRSVERTLGEGWSGRLPSQALAALAAAEDAETRRRAKRLAGDLDTIVGKALERDPERRYGTAAALAEDVERHLTQRPVTARRPTLSYRLGRTVIRHKLAAALALAVCLFAVISFGSALAIRRERDRAKAQRQRAEAQRERAEALNGFLRGLIQKADPMQSRRESLTVRQVLDAGSEDLLGRDSRYQPETWAALLQATGTIYRDLGLDEQAKKNLLRALALREPLRESGRDAALAWAETLTALGSVTLDHAESRGFYQRALAAKERWLGPTALALAEDLNGLGSGFLDDGNFEEAGRNFERACAISRLAGEGGLGDLANCYNNLGGVAVRREEFARARSLFSEALRYYRSTLGADHPSTVKARSNLAFLLSEEGDYARAEALYQEIVDVRRRFLEPNHPDLAVALLDLAIAQHDGRHLDQARATLDELLKMRRDYRFPRDVSEGETWNLVAAVAIDSKDLDAAEAAYARSDEVFRSLPGDRRVDLSNVLNGRARVRLLRNDPAGALTLALRSRALAQSMGVQSADALARAEIVLGLCYLTLGQPSLASPPLEHSYKALLDLYGTDHPSTREAASYLRRLNLAGG